MKKCLLLFFLSVVFAILSPAQKFSYEYEGQKLQYKIQDADPTTVYVSAFFPDLQAQPDEELGFPPVDIVVPETVSYEGKTYTVTGLANDAFFWPGAQWVVSISLPNTITYIGNSALRRCTHLRSIALPASLRTIGAEAFSGCPLESVEFASMESLLNISFMSNPLEIAHKLYIDGEYIEDLVIPDGITDIGNLAFAGGDFKSVEIPNSVVAIGDRAFAFCEKITELNLPNSVSNIGKEAFGSCPNLMQLTLPNSLKTIGQGAFQGCESLTSLVIPNSVESIGDFAFMDCSIEEIMIEEGPLNLNVGQLIFPDVKVKKIYIGRPHSGRLMKNYTPLESLTLGNCVKEVIDNEFFGFNNLSSVTFGSNLATIGEYAFEGCTKLTRIVLPPSVEIIKTGAFARSSIAEVAIGYGVTAIDSNAFESCPVEAVAITAPTAPAVGENVFSNLDFKFMVEGREAKENFASSPDFWSRLNSELLTEPYNVTYDGPETLEGQVYDVFNLTATVQPEDVDYPNIFWNTTNPDIATVTTDGVVTLQPGLSGMEATAQEYITAGTIYTNTINAVKVRIQNSDQPGGIEDITTEDSATAVIDYSAPYAVYGLDGRLAGDSTDGLAKGIYIIRQGEIAKKILVNSER